MVTIQALLKGTRDNLFQSLYIVGEFGYADGWEGPEWTRASRSRAGR